jgi:PKD repeat protein
MALPRLQVVVHQLNNYTTAGTYTVLLIATNACGTDTARRQVTISPTGIIETEVPVAKIYQPNGNEIRIEYPQNNQDRDIMIYNTSGQLVFSGKTDNSQSIQSIDISSFAAGVYIIRAGNSTKRFIR